MSRGVEGLHGWLGGTGRDRVVMGSTIVSANAQWLIRKRNLARTDGCPSYVVAMVHVVPQFHVLGRRLGTLTGDE